jgi:hypothetical protein
MQPPLLRAQTVGPARHKSCHRNYQEPACHQSVFHLNPNIHPQKMRPLLPGPIWPFTAIQIESNTFFSMPHDARNFSASVVNPAGVSLAGTLRTFYGNRVAAYSGCFDHANWLNLL